MGMSRKDYTLIAETFNARLQAKVGLSLNHDQKQAVEMVAMDLAFKFTEDNPRFSFEKFINAINRVKETVNRW